MDKLKDIASLVLTGKITLEMALEQAFVSGWNDAASIHEDIEFMDEVID